MAFWLLLGVWLLSTLAELALRPKPRIGAPQPSSRSAFSTPTSDEGRVIPWVCGSALIQSPNVLWWGDYDEDPIIQSGQQVGTHYFLGLQYGICLGPIDRVLDIRFDNKDLIVQPISITASVLIVKVGATSYPVTFPAATYPTQADAAIDFTNLLRAGVPDPAIRVVYGYEIKLGVNDLLYCYIQRGLAIFNGGVIARPGTYDGPGYAAELNYQLERMGAGWASGTFIYDPGTFRMGISATGHVSIDHTRSNALATFGFNDLLDVTVNGSTGYADPTRPYRYWFMFSPGTTIAWSDGSTTAESLFGNFAGADFTVPQVCDTDRVPGGEFTTIVELPYQTRVTINAPSIFGGDVIGGEGGITGEMDIYHGTDDQPFNDYLQAKFAAEAPRWPGLCYAVARQLYQGNAPQLKTIQFIVERCPNPIGLTGGQHRISVGTLGDDANPACVLYELLNNDDWGLGIGASLLDLDSFQACAQVLFDEGLGLSLTVDSAAQAIDLINEFCRHIDGVLYSDPLTGQISLRLIRPDYRIEELPVLDQSCITSLQMASATWDQTKGIVKLTYVDRTANHQNRVYQAHNQANITLTGRAEVDEVNYNGLTNPQAAKLVADRHLATVSYPLKRFEIVTNRAAWARRPGDAFVLNWPKLGIAGMVCRVTRIQPGEIRDNRVTLEAAEDIYGLKYTAFSSIA